MHWHPGDHAPLEPCLATQTAWGSERAREEGMGHVAAWHLSLIVPKEVWYGVEAKNMEPESEGLFFFLFFSLRWTAKVGLAYVATG